MKPAIFALLFFSCGLLHASSETQTCVNLTGKYATGRVIANAQYFLSVYQNACDTIAIGSYAVRKDVVIEETPGVISYVTEKTLDKCELNTCTVFQTTATGISFARLGTAPVSPNCRYNRVEWSLESNGDLKQVYFVADKSSRCAGITTIEHRLSR